MPSTRVLLVTPPSDCTLQVAPDLGIGYLASALREHLYSVDFVDMGRDKVSVEQLSRKAGENDYLMVGIKVFSTSVATVNGIISAIKKSLPQTKIVIGGPHPTLVPREAMQACPQADFGVIGEGDSAIVEIARCIEHRNNFGEIASIAFRENDTVRLNPKKIDIDLEKLHTPAWDLMEPERYIGRENLWLLCRGKRPAHILLTRGALEGKLRYRNLSEIADEIERLIRILGVDEIVIADPVFSIERTYVYEFCEMFIRKGFKIPWAAPYSSGKFSLDAALLRAMREAGCYGVSVSIESGSERIMKEIYKSDPPKTFGEKVRLIKETGGMLVKGTFRVGNPTETFGDFQETIELARGLPIDLAVFAPICLMPQGVAIEYLQEHEPEALPDWSSEKLKKNVYRPNGLSIEELETWSRKAYRAFYLRPSTLFKIPFLFSGAGNFKLVAARLRKPNYL